MRLHAPFASEKEIEEIVDFLKEQQDVVYEESFFKDESSAVGSSENGLNAGEADELYEEAKSIILSEEKTSISYLQRRLKIGYNRAASIIEQLEIAGVLTPVNAKGQRDIIR
ncbi:DNA translocase FtsK [Campylobacter fetus]|uniref:DNA translocase FtsK n=1 Tax=Campylobacter fetus TaxID=196 RepID=UPI003977D3D5